jgi:hypothetical protein
MFQAFFISLANVAKIPGSVIIKQLTHDFDVFQLLLLPFQRISDALAKPLDLRDAFCQLDREGLDADDPTSASAMATEPEAVEG